MEKIKLVIKKKEGSIELNDIEIKHEPNAQELIDAKKY